MESPVATTFFVFFFLFRPRVLFDESLVPSGSDALSLFFSFLRFFYLFVSVRLEPQPLSTRNLLLRVRGVGL